MTTLDDLPTDKVAPECVRVVPPTIFDVKWERAPLVDTAVGFVIVREADVTVAKANADRLATKAHPGEGLGSVELWVDAYTTHLMSWIVAYGTCDPNDIYKRWDFLPLDPDRVSPGALTSDGLKHLFDLYERFRVEVDPTQAPLLDAELPAFVAALPKLNEIAKTDRPRAMRARRLLGFVYAELLDAE